MPVEGKERFDFRNYFNTDFTTINTIYNNQYNLSYLIYLFII